MAIFRLFNMAAAAILDFSNFNFLTVGWLKRAELRRRVKFGGNRSKRGRDMVIFRFFKMAAAATPPSCIFQISNFWRPDGSRGPKCVTVPNLVEIRQTATEIWRFFDFSSKMVAVLHLGFVMCVFGHPRREFGGLYHCAIFGWNRCGSFDNMHVFRFHHLGSKMPIHAPKIGVFGGFYPLNGEQCQGSPQRARPCASPRRLSHHARKTADASDL